MAGRHPQFPLLGSFWDNKHRACHITKEGRVSVDDCFYVFYLFHHYLVTHGANIFVLLLCSTTFVAAQDPHAQPPDVGRVVRVIHTTCGVPVACSTTHRWSADDGLCCVDDTYGPVVSGGHHVPPSMWENHSDAAGRRHDPWSL
jgi:hypothetical protein